MPKKIKEIKGEMLEIKEQEIFPCCAECRYVFTKVEKGFFKKTKYAGCSAQAYRFVEEVYNSENCKGIYRQQLNIPMIEVKFNDKGELEA